MFASITDITFGLTTSGRTSGVITQSAQSNTQGNKGSRPTVMHSAFQNAGKRAGLEIWRVEVRILHSRWNFPFAFVLFCRFIYDQSLTIMWIATTLKIKFIRIKIERIENEMWCGVNARNL